MSLFAQNSLYSFTPWLYSEMCLEKPKSESLNTLLKIKTLSALTSLCAILRECMCARPLPTYHKISFFFCSVSSAFCAWISLKNLMKSTSAFSIRIPYRCFVSIALVPDIPSKRLGRKGCLSECITLASLTSC